MNGHEKKCGSGLAAATWSVKVVCPVHYMTFISWSVT